MKRFLYIFATVLVLAASVVSLMPAKPASADFASQDSAIKALCGDGKTVPPHAGNTTVKSADEIKKEYNACVKGFYAAISSDAPAPKKNTSDPCYTTIFKGVNSESGACEQAYVQTYPNRVKYNALPQHNPTDKNTPDPTALAACDPAIPSGNNHDDLVNVCVKAYTDAASGKSKDEACGYLQGSAGSDAALSACQKGVDLQVAASNTNGNGNDHPTCEASGFSLSWILCPIINGLASATDHIYSDIVEPLLITKPVQLTNTTNDPTHAFDIWSNFRIYGDILLTIALLIAVFGESIGGGIVDAYTAKKIFPRLVIATILVNLSIYIVAIAVDVTNIIGGSISAIIEAPFKNADAFKLHISGGTGDLGMAALVGGVAWGIAALGPFLEFLLLFILIPGFLIFLAILVTIMIRQGLIIFLLLISPVAFALYCLPNTEKYFKKWWELLVQTLMVYPIVAALFAIANVLAVTIDSATTGLSKNVADIVAVLAMFAPLFLIPYSFRFAGGVIGRLHEVASNYGKRGSEAIKGNANDPDSWRNRVRSKVKQRNAELGLDGKGLKSTFIPPRGVLQSGGAGQWRQQRRAQIQATRTNLGQQFFENDSVAKANKGNDQFYLAVANPKLAREMRDQTAVGSADRASWDNAIAAAGLVPSTPAIRMAAAQQHASTGFQYETGQVGYNQLAETMADITGVELEYDPRSHDVVGVKTGQKNSAAWQDAMDNAQFALKGAGRFDLAGINRGNGYSAEKGLGKASLYEIANGKPESVEAMMQSAGEGPAGMQHAVVYKELQAMLPNTKGAIRDQVLESMRNLEGRGVRQYMSREVAGEGPRPTRVMFDNLAPTAGTWSAEERQRGWRMEDRVPTYGDVAQQSARSYERPDPNTMLT